MDLTNKLVVEKLEAKNQQDKNVIKSEKEVNNDWEHLKITSPIWSWIAKVSLTLGFCVVILEIIIMAPDVNIWPSTSGAIEDLDSMILSMCMTFLMLIIYAIFVYKGQEKVIYTTVTLQNDTVYKQKSHISNENYLLTNIAMALLIINFLLFYGFVALTSTHDEYANYSAIFSIVVTIILAIAIPMAISNISQQNAKRKTWLKFNKWLGTNADSKYSILEKLDFAKDLNYEQIVSELGINDDFLVLNSKNKGKTEQNISLFNNIELMELRNILKAYNDNLDKQDKLLDKIKWKRKSKTGKITINSSIRNNNLTRNIKRLNNYNEILTSIVFTYYNDKF